MSRGNHEQPYEVDLSNIVFDLHAFEASNRTLSQQLPTSVHENFAVDVRPELPDETAWLAADMLSVRAHSHILPNLHGMGSGVGTVFGPEDIRLYGELPATLLGIAAVETVLPSLGLRAIRTGVLSEKYLWMEEQVAKFQHENPYATGREIGSLIDTLRGH